MKPKILVFVLAVLMRWPHAGATEPPRTDINPALLYWQAFAVLPDLPDADEKYFFNNEWRSRPMDDRAGQIALRFDSTFRLLQHAALSQVPCDWGVDLGDGPYAMLPQLAKAKRCAQAAVLRARWFVQQGRPDDARPDLVAAFVLGRNLSRDQVLISALVQIAIENIISGYVVQQWPELSTEMIGALLDAFDKAPARGTMAASMRTEKTAFYGWLVRKVKELQVKYPKDDPKGLAEAEGLITGMVSEENQLRKDLAADILAASGNSLSGLLEYVGQMQPYYDEVERTMTLPYSEFQPALDELQKRIAASPNLLLHEFFPAFNKVRLKEFRITARMGMLHAAYQYRLDPANGLRQVPDPFGNGPFEMSRFVMDGTDRGFKLTSQLQLPDFKEALIFAERSGPAFSVDGPSAGENTLISLVKSGPAQTDGSPDLLSRAQAGDGESFWLLCAPLKERLARQALALCRDEVRAQDLVQETLVEAWKSIQRFNRQCQLSTWLCSIMLHRHKSLLRSWNWRALMNRLTGGEEQTAVANLRDHAPLPDRAADLSDRSRLILKTLDRLPSQQRAVVFLRFYADESLEEIAIALNCSIGTVKSRLFHGLENLRRMNTLRREFL